MHFLTPVLLRKIKANNSAHSWSAPVLESSLPFPKAKVALAATVTVEGNRVHRAMLSRGRAAAKTSCR